jgi:hypothetical protein
MKQLFILAQTIHINGLPQVNAGPTTLNNIFSIGSVVAGGMSILFLLIGAARYALSAGDSGQAKQAKDTILYSIIGLVVSTSAFFVVQFVLGSVNNP